MEMQEVLLRTQQDERDHELDLQKVEKEHSNKMIKHALDLHVHNNPQKKESK